MLTKTQKACMVKAVTIVTMTLLLSGFVAGCSASPESSEQNNRKKDKEIELQKQMNQEQNNMHEQDSNQAEDQASDGHTTETEVQNPSDSNEKTVEARIMIRSDNQITISSQEVLEQLDKEIEHLLKSLDNMDSISDEQLDF